MLPFVDLSPDQNHEYFADGLSEGLLNGLAKLSGLQVIGRTSSFSFKGTTTDIQSIGRLLNVGHILEGSVHSSNNRLRITAQLVDTSNGIQVWSEQYDRQLDDIFVIQDQIGESVATALSIKLGVGDLSDLAGGTRNLEAYDEVLLGQSLYRQFTRDSVLSAIDHFNEAVELDPDYALAWERLADVYTTARFVVPAEALGNWKQLSGEALDRALSLAPDSEDILTTVAFRQVHLMQWQEAQRTLNRGPPLDVTMRTPTIDSYSTLLMNVGRSRDAIAPIERGRRLDPLSGIPALYSGAVYTHIGRFEEAFAEYERGFNLGGYLPVISEHAMIAALASGDSALSQKWIARAIEHAPVGRRENETMSRLFGDREASLEWLHRDHDPSPLNPYFGAIWAAYYGDSEFALHLMQPQLKNFWWLWTPLMVNVRKLPGFKDLVREHGLVDYWREFGWGDYCQPLGADDFECT